MDDKRSMSDTVIFLSANHVTWSSRKQASVSRSRAFFDSGLTF